VQVRSEGTDDQLRSYLGGGKGDRPVEAPGTTALFWRVCKYAGRNASEA
jgi:hypothetical protein